MTTAYEVFGGGVAVITGAGSGIGEGLAVHAATELGMTVALADIDEQAIDRVRQTIEHAGGAAICFATDVRDPDALDRLAQRCYDELGPVRLLVNNAGIEQFGYLWDVPVENWRRLVDINISGVFHGVRSFVPRMISAGERAYILNLSSIGGVSAAPLQAPYIMSKHAVLGLTESLHLEMRLAGVDIQVCAVLPGAVASQIFQGAGGVTSGDSEAAEAERAAMLEIAGEAMDAAACRGDDLRAGGRRRVLHRDPTRGVPGGDAPRADQLAERRVPVLRAERSAPAA